MEAVVRLTAFFGIFLIMALLEIAAPHRKLSLSKSWRWFTNLSLTALDMVVVRLIFGTATIATAHFAREHGWGLLNYLHLPPWLTFLSTVIFLDFMIYIQHVLSHAVPIFWRLHLVHHTDLDFDVTTAARFHPLEIIVSLIYKLGLIVVIGAMPAAVLVFEIILNSSAQFNHANLKIPEWLDRTIRRFIITPDFHRIHHSVERAETNSNYGFFLPWWDYLCGTYRAQPSRSHREMSIGLKEYRDKGELSLPSLVILPFVARTGQFDRQD